MTLGNAAARVLLIIWCKACQHQVEPDPAEMAARVRHRNARARLAQVLVCSWRGSRQVDMVVSGGKERE
jgi:hypothetical protein